MVKAAKKKARFVGYEQLWALLSDLRVAAFTVDVHRRITSFNRAAELITGHDERDVLGKHCHEVFLSDLCHGECKYHEAVEAEREALSFELEITDAHGEKHRVTKTVAPLYDARGKLAGCMEVFQDHSAIEELINRIRYDERQLKMILDNLDIGILTVTRGGLVTFFNRLAEEMSGFSRREVLGKPYSTLLNEDPVIGSRLLQQAIADGTSRFHAQGRVRSRDGCDLPIRAKYMALRNEQGKIVGGLATIQDLSLIDRLQRQIKNRYTFADMVGRDPAMERVFEIADVVASTDATVLIEGPTGTGKDLLAKVIHSRSSRAKRPWVKVNCAALPDNLLESELFGYVKGAFTGADKDKPGRFQEADGGTIFLDEIGDMPPPLQAKLLRVLEEREFYPLGSRRTTKVDVRIIAATNQGLGKLVEAKRFREDLYYRLNVVRLELPPLVERKPDLPLLIGYILRKLCAERGRPAPRIAEEAMEVLLNHDYPGNVRELENILEHALIVCQDALIERRHLPLSIQGGPREAPPGPSLEPGELLSRERTLILEALKRHAWHRGRSARALGMDRSTLWRKMKKYRITPA